MTREVRRPAVAVVRLIRVTYLVGAGIVPDDPVREVTAYYDFDGELGRGRDPIFEVDSWLRDRPLAPEPRVTG